MSDEKFEDLVGVVFTDITVTKDSYNDRITFTTTDDKRYFMYHSQDCCETVVIDDICGDTEDLLNTPILQAEVAVNSDALPDTYDSHTWTFYKLATIKGSVTIKWHGSSNGYYSESVSFGMVH